MKIILICATLGILFLVILRYSSPKPPYQDDEKLVDAITAKTAQKLKDEKGLILVGTGGRMMDDIKMLMMGFDCSKEVDVEKARELLIYCVKEYLSEINSSKEIRPFLHNYPFTPKNVEIVIYFHNSDRSRVPSDKITVAASNDGEIIYYVYDLEKRTLKTLCEESYERALQSISSEK
jgi:hypothetical protein